MDAFAKTKEMFMKAVPFNYPISYDTWLSVRDSHKAAVLYVNFYKEICLAWFKAKADFTPDEDGVSTIMQYLIKNVPVIIDDPKRFSPQYIYKVAYNSMGCLRRVISNMNHFNNTVSQYTVGPDGGEIDLFGAIVDEDPQFRSSKLQSILDSLSDDEIKLVDKLIDKYLHKSSPYKEGTQAYKNAMKLRRKFLDLYIDNIDYVKFEAVYPLRDVIEIVVSIPSGDTAVYEQTLTSGDEVYIKFFGSKGDYIVPFDRALNYRVISTD